MLLRPSCGPCRKQALWAEALNWCPFLAQTPRHSPTPNHESRGQDHSHPGWFCRQTCLLCPPAPLCTFTGDPGQGSVVLVLGSEGRCHLQFVGGRLGRGCSALLVRAAGLTLWAVGEHPQETTSPVTPMLGCGFQGLKSCIDIAAQAASAKLNPGSPVVEIIP